LSLLEGEVVIHLTVADIDLDQVVTVKATDTSEQIGPFNPIQSLQRTTDTLGQWRIRRRDAKVVNSQGNRSSTSSTIGEISSIPDTQMDVVGDFAP